VFSRRRFSGLRGIYLTTFFLNFGLALLDIFIPVFVWQKTGQIGIVFGFYFIYYLAVVLATPLAATLLKKFISPDYAYFLSVLGRLTYLFFLFLGGQNQLFFFLAAFFWGLTIPFCWLPYYLTVVYEEKEDGFFGKEVSYMNLLSSLAAALSPILGGLLITLYGAGSAYLLAGFFFVLSFLPLYFDRFNPSRVEFSFKDTRFFMKGKQEKSLKRAFWGNGLEAVAILSWPLFIFANLGQYQALGLIKGLSILFSFLLMIWIGRLVDRRGKKIINWGVGLNVFNWLWRITARTPLGFFIFDFLGTVGSILVNTPLQALVYEKARGRYSPLEILVAREMITNLAAALSCLLLVFFSKTSFFWPVSFFLGALGAILVYGNDGQKE